MKTTYFGDKNDLVTQMVSDKIGFLTFSLMFFLP